MYDFDGGNLFWNYSRIEADSWYVEEVRSVLPFQAVYGEIQHYLNLLPPPKIA